jgi:hypothetical protein
VRGNDQDAIDRGFRRGIEIFITENKKNVQKQKKQEANARLQLQGS